MTDPITIAILAIGGEGGGVLADWIGDLGEANGHVAQTTLVPGVAQRTGATIYYVELYPQAQAEADGGQPVLALMPLPGDVDVVLASELMEAGRAVQRGFATRDRTTVIASTHRVYSISENSALGDGRVDSAELLNHAEAVAKRFIRFDMAAAAEQSGSVINALLFGALAGSGVLPFSRAAFGATIARSGIGVKPSLNAFASAFDRAQVDPSDEPATEAAATPVPRSRHPEFRALVEHVQQSFPIATQDLLLEGVRRLIDYQDTVYADPCFDRMAPICALDCNDAGRLARSTAFHFALWIAYEDTARMAALKTRASRFERVRSEARVQDGQVLAINEYVHLRLQEICETLPAGIGHSLIRSGAPRRLVKRLTRRGRVIQTSSLRGYLMLHTVAGMRRWGCWTLRDAEEIRRIEAWLECIAATAPRNPALALEVAECQRIAKGSSDTHERGVRNYDTLITAVQHAGASLAPATLRELRDAALADEHGHRLRAVLAQFALA